MGSWHGQRFADNAKYLFIHCSERYRDQIKCVWLSRNADVIKEVRALGHVAHSTLGFRGLWYALTAGVHLFDCYATDTNFWLSRGSLAVNLWHGIPLKKIERDIDIPGHPFRTRYHGNIAQRMYHAFCWPWHFVRPDMMTATSPTVAESFSSAFDVPVSRIPILGFPRNDAIVAEGVSGDALGLPTWLHRAISDGRRIILYMPTFRGAGRTDHTIPIDWAELDEILERENAVFLMKLHPVERADVASMGEFRNIAVIPSEVDIYPMLKEVDVLVTDYSSIWFDFVLLDRPVVFFAYDLEAYLRADRPMYVDYDEVIAGPRVGKWKELASELLKALNTTAEDDPWRSKRHWVLSRYHRHRDEHNCHRIAVEIGRRVGVVVDRC